jgi:hypothetical protein
LQSASSSPPLSSPLSVTKSKAKSTKATVKAVNQNQSDMPQFMQLTCINYYAGAACQVVLDCSSEL